MRTPVRLAPALVSVAIACSARRPPPPGEADRAPAAITAAPAPPDAAAPPAAAGCDGSAHPLAPGVSHERWAVDATPAIAIAPCIDLVRVDPARHPLRVVTASRDGDPRPAPAWLDAAGLIAAINAGMFHEGGTSIGLLIDGDHENNNRDNPKLGGFLAFGPRRAGLPPVVIAGRDCPGFDLAALRADYRSITQSYRLLGCRGEALPWADPKSYSAAAIALDQRGNVVLIHARAPFHMSELSRTLARRELGLTGALFVEGGPEATVAVAGDAGDLTLIGSYETGFVEDDTNVRAWPLPNLIGLAR